MKIVRAEELGFCYGVARAAEMVESLIEENKILKAQILKK